MNRHSMMVRADARAVGMVTATRVGGGNRKPRTYTRASEVISYHADDTSDHTLVPRDRSNATIFRAERAPRKPRIAAIPDTPHRTMAWDLDPVMAD